MLVMGLRQMLKICRSLISIYWASIMCQHMLGDSKMCEKQVLPSRSECITRDIRLTHKNPTENIYIYVCVKDNYSHSGDNSKCCGRQWSINRKGTGITAKRCCFWNSHIMFREGNGTPLQYSCLENPMGGGAWWAYSPWVDKSWTRLSDFTFTFHFPALEKEMATRSSVLAWRIPGTEEPSGLPPKGSHRVGHD